MPLSSLDLVSLRHAYRNGATPVQVIEQVIAATARDSRNVWISRRSDADLIAAAQQLASRDPASLPLYGVPFAVKDNIDVAAIPTTAACPAFTYVPTDHAAVVAALIAKGAIPVGKTNLDQFATGLNGTRSPYGACANAFNDAYISGGSSSGSAVAVALGQVSFALGTDTAGSGRVPAAFNNIIGYKPTKRLLSRAGVVPAMRMQDVVSIFALTAADAAEVFGCAYDLATDAHSCSLRPHGFDFGAAQRFRLGVPPPTQLDFDGDREAERLYGAAVAVLAELGAELREIDIGPLLDAARLLYGSALVAERTHALKDLLVRDPGAIHPVVREIVEAGGRYDATAVFDALYSVDTLRHVSASALADCDVLVLPTAPRLYTIADMLAAPIALNAKLGTYTNFVNLLDMAAVAVPAGLGANGLPWGVSLIAQAHQDMPLLRLAEKLHPRLSARLGAMQTPTPAPRLASVQTPWQSGRLRLAVCGAHMEGLPLHGQIRARDGRLVARTTSAPIYRLYALAGGPPARPGMVKVGAGGAAIELEVWDIAGDTFGAFCQGVPAPLAIGKVMLADGSEVPGFVCETAGTEGATDITAFGGWRAYLAARA